MNTAKARPDGLEPIETASRDELQALQLERLRWSLDHAFANVAHFRAKCEAQGVHPDDLRAPEDLAKFPFTTKADLRDTYPFGMFAVSMDRVARVHASRGTTGRATVVGYTRRDIDTWAGLVARSIRASGGRPGDMCHVAYGYGLFTGGLGAHYGRQQLGCTVIPMGGGQTERQIQLIADLKPRIIMMTRSYALNMAEEMERVSVDPRSTSLEIGIFGAEPWTERYARRDRGPLRHRRGRHLRPLRGHGPPASPTSASRRRTAPTLWEDHFLPPRLSSPRPARPPAGRRRARVHGRSRRRPCRSSAIGTRDLTRLLPPTARSMRRMARITGRSDDMLIIRGVNVFPSQVEELVLKMPALAPVYQLVVTREGHMDELEVRVELRPETGDEGAAAAELRHHIKSFIGVSTRVSVLAPSGIERSVGKARRVVDQRPKG
jgi:phenylacetate-CoA ligase